MSKRKEKAPLEVVKRLAPKLETLRLLFGLSGNCCAFDGCSNRLFNDNNKLVGQVCHIESALAGGERFNPDSSNEQRRSFENLLVLCYEHHIETDDVISYPTGRLLEMKTAHEKLYSGKFNPNQLQLDDAFEREMQKSLIRIEDNTIGIQNVQSEHGEVLSDVQQMLKQIVSGVVTGGNSKSNLGSRIEEIDAVRIEGKQQAAILLFEQLKEDNWSLLSDHEKYRTIASIGLCHFDLGELKKAASLFIEALAYDQENIKAINLGVLGYSILEENDLAKTWIDRGLTIDGEYASIWAAKVRLALEVKPERLLEEIPSSLKKNPDVAFEVGRRFLIVGDFNEAIRWMKSSAKNCTEGQSEVINGTLATVILQSIFDQFILESGQVSAQHKEEAKYIIHLYDKAWSCIEGTDAKKTKVSYLLNRGIAKKINDDLDGFYEDSLLASIINPDYQTLDHFLKVCLELGKHTKFSETTLALRNLASEAQKLELDYWDAHLLLNLNKIQEAEAEFSRLLELNLPEKTKIMVLLDYVGLLMYTERFAMADDLVSQLEMLLPDRISTWVLRARVEDRLGRKDIKIGLCEVAERVDASMSKAEIELLVKNLLEYDLIKPAIILLEIITDLKIYTRYTDQLLRLYYHSGETSKILSSCEYLLQKYGPIRHCTELTSYVYERIRNEVKAIQTCREYLEVYPDDQQIRYRLASIYFRLKDINNLRDQMGYFEYLDSNLSMRVQFTLCEYLVMSGFESRGFNFAYEVRRRFFEEGLTHDTFIYLSMEMKTLGKVSVNASVIEQDCVVLVRGNGKEQIFIIEDRQDGIFSRGEVDIRSFEATALLGKSVGDRLYLHESYPDDVVEVCQIQHKFNYAVSESFKLIQGPMASKTSFKKFSIPEGTPEGDKGKVMLEMLDGIAQQGRQIDVLFEKGQLPLGAIASLKGRNVIDIWKEVISTPGRELINTGPKEEIGLVHVILADQVPIVIDVISIMTLFSLGLEGLLSKLPNKIIVLKSSLDEIDGHLNDLQLKSAGYVSIEKIDGEFVRIITTAEEIVAEMNKIRKIIDWIVSHCEVVPCTAALKINDKVRQEYQENFGESFIDTMLTAKEMNALLFSEEMLLRQIAMHEYKVSGMTCFILLLHLRQMDLITHQHVGEACISLMDMHYNTLPANKGILLKIVDRENYVLSPALSFAIEGLASEYLNVHASIANSIWFIVDLYKIKLKNNSEENEKSLSAIVCKVLSVMASRWQPESFKELFINNIKKALGEEQSKLAVIAVESYFKNLNLDKNSE